MCLDTETPSHCEGVSQWRLDARIRCLHPSPSPWRAPISDTNKEEPRGRRHDEGWSDLQDVDVAPSFLICSCELSDRKLVLKANGPPVIPLVSPLQFAFPLSSRATNGGGQRERKRESFAIARRPPPLELCFAQFDKNQRCGTSSGKRHTSTLREQDYKRTRVHQHGPTRERRNTGPSSLEKAHSDIYPS
ncbi:hypothetical protein PC128_g13224 [Phytophthora cactorum]|nr:hypothetical protein PC128_g13224 [Phytophthora cactorum]